MTQIEVTLANAKDLLYAEDGNLPKQKVRQVSTQMRVDNTPIMAISVETHRRLGIKVKRSQKAELNGEVLEMNIVGPIEVYYADKSCTVDAFVLPPNHEQILGTIVIEYLDLAFEK